MFVAKDSKTNEVLLHRVTKHGAHDQSTHNPKKGGGGGGGGSQDRISSPSDTTLKENLSALSGQEKNLRDIASGKRRGYRGSRVEGGGDEYTKPAADSTKKAADHLKSAQKYAALPDSKRDMSAMKIEMTNARTEIQRAMDIFENENYHDLTSGLKSIKDNISSISSAISRNVNVGDNLRDPFKQDN